jgi:hypothetical protein
MRRRVGRQRVLVLLFMLAVLAVAGRAGARTVEVFSIKGAQNAIVIPDDWNGDLFVYAHGYSADKRILAPLSPDLVGSNTLLLPGLAFVPPGSAAAVTTFRSVGWYLKDAVKDIENLRRHFVKKYGKPKHTYMWGHSGGGIVTEAVIEAFPRTYDGAAPMCGPGAGGWRNFNAAFDLRVLYEYVCKDVPGARFTCRVCSDGRSRCLTDAHCPSGLTCAAETATRARGGAHARVHDFLLDNPATFSEDPTALGGDFVTAALTPCFGELTRGVVSHRQREFLPARVTDSGQLPRHGHVLREHRHGGGVPSPHERQASMGQRRRGLRVAAPHREGAGGVQCRGTAHDRRRRGRPLHAPLLRAARPDAREGRHRARARRRPRPARERDEVRPGLRGGEQRGPARPALQPDRRTLPLPERLDAGAPRPAGMGRGRDEADDGRGLRGVRRLPPETTPAWGLRRQRLEGVAPRTSSRQPARRLSSRDDLRRTKHR